MFATMYLLAGSLVTVDTGWQPLDGGGFEYIIQIEPELLDAIKAGEEFTSEIPRSFRDVRSFRIRYGTAPVPRDGDPTSAKAEGSPTPAEPPADASKVRPASAETPIDEATHGTTPPQDFTMLRQPGAGGYRPNLGAAPPTVKEKDENAAEKPRLPAGTGNKPLNQEAGFGERADPGQAIKPNTNASVAAAEKSAGFAGKVDLKTPQSSSKSIRNETSPSDGKAGTSGSPPKAGSSRSGSGSPKNAAADDDEKPWWPLTLTAFGLFISLGGNAYLGMMAWQLRERCQSLLRNKGGYSTGSSSDASPSGGRNYNLSSAAGDDEDQDVRAVDDSQSWRSRRG